MSKEREVSLKPGPLLHDVKHCRCREAEGRVAGVKGKLWATFIPAEPVSVSPRVQQPRGVSIVARDFQTVALYKADGTFAGIRRPGSNKPIEVRASGCSSCVLQAWPCTLMEPPRE